LILRCVVNSELFPELLIPDHLSNGGDRGLGTLIPPLKRRLLQVGTLINPDGFIPNKPSGQGPLEVDSKGPTVRVIVTTVVHFELTEFRTRFSNR
jgi:hypothetical protein